MAATLKNIGSRATEIGFGAALLFTDNSRADNLDWPDAIVLDPDTYIGPWDDPTQTADGCWRFPEDGHRLKQSILKWRELALGDTLRESYAVYTHGTSQPCLPPGTYRFQDKGCADSESQSMVLTLRIEIDENQQVSVGTEQPTFTAD